MAKLLPIVKHPNDILRKKSKIIKFNNSKNKIKALLPDMTKTMLEEDGSGLAAPQIGKNIRLIVVNTKDEILCMINPKILKKSWAKFWFEEGCLSVPGFFGEVKRAKKINCQYLDKSGNKTTIKAEGLLADIIQHEIDHLDGILFIDKARKLEKI